MIVHLNLKKNIIATLHDNLDIMVQIYYLISQSYPLYELMETITKDVRNYAKNYTIFQITHNKKFKKPLNKQIITKNPRDRYVVDIKY